MDKVESLRSIYESSVREIKDFLVREIPGSKIDVGEDFERDGVILKAAPGSAPGFRVFVSHEFLSDVNREKICSLFRRWDLLGELATLPDDSTLFVVPTGTFRERTQGRTLRETTRRFSEVFSPSTELSALYERVFSIRIDGVALGNTPVEMQGDPDLYISYSESFANALGAAYLLDGAGYRDFRLDAVRFDEHPGVDFQVHLRSGEVAFLEFKRAVTPTERRANALREQVNVMLRSEMRQGGALSAAIDGYFIQITIPIAPTSKTEVERLVNEIRQFGTSREWADLTGGSLVPFDASHYPLLVSLGARVYVSVGATHISVAEGAKSFDPNAPYRIARQFISELSIQRFNVRPVWLGVSLADSVIMTSEESLQALLRNIDPLQTPFDQIIVGSAGAVKVWPRDAEQPAST